jgi:hypothetical protein
MKVRMDWIRMDAWKDGLTRSEWMHGSTDGLDKNGCMERRTDGRTNGCLGEWMYGWEWMHGSTDGSDRNACMERRMTWKMDGRTELEWTGIDG